MPIAGPRGILECTYRRHAIVTTVIIASHNTGKIGEFNALLADLAITVVSARERGIDAFPPEVGATFRENAEAKARFVAGATGAPALADDSGLVIDALNGAPGVYSARYGTDGMDDHDRLMLVLQQMENVPHERRTARFVSVVAFAMPNGAVTSGEGRIEGHIAIAARGSQGFGYDPIFLPEGSDRTFAEMDADEKNQISHRSRALRAVKPQVGTLLAARRDV